MRISDWSSDVGSSDLVGYVGVYDLDVQRRDSDTAQSEYGRSYLSLVYPESVAERHAQSPIYGVDRIKAAVMLVHGAKDERVPRSEERRVGKEDVSTCRSRGLADH